MTSPIIGDDTVFVGSDDGHLYAFDARTGADRWRFDLGAPSNVPVFGDGVVAVADRNGVLHGVDGRDGHRAMAYAANRQHDRAVLADGHRLHHRHRPRAHGFDLQTGAERWSWTTTADLSNALVIGARCRLRLIA